jgi:hypothetical protein
MISGNQWNDLRLGELSHPLLEDANDRFANGSSPDLHIAASKAAGNKVYEVRSRTGAAWRGAVVLDKAGDPWLVYAEKHDRFHSRAAEHLKSAKALDYMPRAVDYKLREREEAVDRDAQWQISILGSLVSIIREAIQSPGMVAKHELPLQSSWSGRYFLEGIVEHDPAATSADTAHLSSSSVDLWLTFSPGSDASCLHRIVQVVIPFLKVQDASIDPIYDLNGALQVQAIITQAKLIQLLADAGDEGELVGVCRMPEPTHLHYVAQSYLMSAFVHGIEVRGICGEWFVPIHGEGAETALPICEPCERGKPNAQFVLDLIRGSGT